MNLLKTIITIQALLAALCGLAGCDPNVLPDLTPPSAGVDVTPAKGGGGRIEPAEIPINVTVTVERREQKSPPIIINERDEFADDCDCGCGRTSCNCKETLDSSTPKSTERQLPKQTSGTPCKTWYEGDNLIWMADGVRWFLTYGGTLNDGESTDGGRFVMRNGQIVDTSGGRVDSVNTSPRYIKQCNENGCRLIQVN